MYTHAAMQPPSHATPSELCLSYYTDIHNPNTPLSSAQVFFFSFYRREDFSSFLSLSLAATLLLELQAWRLLFFFSSPSLFSSFFLLYFSKRVLFAVGVSFENRVTPFSFFSFSLSFFSPSSQQKRGTKINKRGRRERQNLAWKWGAVPARHKGGSREQPPRKSGVPYPKEDLMGVGVGGAS